MQTMRRTTASWRLFILHFWGINISKRPYLPWKLRRHISSCWRFNKHVVKFNLNSDYLYEGTYRIKLFTEYYHYNIKPNKPTRTSHGVQRPSELSNQTQTTCESVSSKYLLVSWRRHRTPLASDRTFYILLSFIPAAPIPGETDFHTSSGVRAAGWTKTNFPSDNVVM